MGKEGEEASRQRDAGRADERVPTAFCTLISVSGPAAWLPWEAPLRPLTQLPFADFCRWSPREA